MWAALEPLLGPLLDKVFSFIPNPEERQKAKLDAMAQLQTATIAAEQSQLDIDKAEAASPSMFVAGWRPAVGWICAIALGWQYILLPVSAYAINVIATMNGTKIPPLPALDTSTLYPLMMSMLGLGAARTIEKIQGVSRDNLTVQPNTK